MNNKQKTKKKKIDNKVVLRCKKYIQPFERVLALAELKGLLGRPAKGLLVESAPDTVSLATADVAILKNRLTYWDVIEFGGEVFLPRQIQYELSEFNGTQLPLGEFGVSDLPKRRKLRYGSHDLHEYRGKFFPQLVRSLINAAGLKPGDIVLDPMCGSGTTNVEARSLGMTTLGADLNPLSVFISKVKSSVFELSNEDFSFIEKVFLEGIVEDNAKSAEPELRWDAKNFEYLSRWFDYKALQELDYVLGKIEEQSSNKILADFLKVCLSNIVRTVSWQSDEDLRVRKNTFNYESGVAITLFKDEVKKNIGKLSWYLSIKDTESVAADCTIVEGDSRFLTNLHPKYIGKCDVIITSPPYATALPYLDTDRLSLVVLGLLSRSEHRGREYNLIGNREISENQRSELWRTYLERRAELPEELNTMIDELAKSNHKSGVGFRRRNLPALLSKYFLDMLDSMTQASKMMKPNCYAFYVVGNNSTSVDGIRTEISTDTFLWEIGKRAGWNQVAFLNMELLPSRDIFRKNRGSSESILVFKSKTNRTSIYGDFDSPHATPTEWDFDGEGTQEHLHSLHPYPARFIPQIPRKAILEYSRPGDIVLDPFCGGGTTLLEASLLGRKSIGVDSNPVACLVSKAKISTYHQEDIDLLSAFCKKLPVNIEKDVSVKKIDIPEYKERDYWFDPIASKDLGYIRWKIKTLPKSVQSIALAVLSSIVVRVSYQDSDTRYARIDKKYLAGSALKWYKQKLFQAIDGIEDIIKLPRTESVVHMADSRNIEVVADDSVTLIVTSPPYLNTYDYHKYHRHRIHWIDGDAALTRDREIGKHDTFTKRFAIPDPYFVDMEKCFIEWARVLKTNGKILIVVGDAIVNGSPVRVGDRFVEILERLGFTLITRWVRNIKTGRKSFNREARIQKEHVLLLEWKDVVGKFSKKPRKHKSR